MKGKGDTHASPFPMSRRHKGLQAYVTYAHPRDRVRFAATLAACQWTLCPQWMDDYPPTLVASQFSPLPRSTTRGTDNGVAFSISSLTKASSSVSSPGG